MVHVDDQSGVPLNGVEVQVSGTTGTVTTGPTSFNAPGEAFFVLAEGTHTMTIKPPDEFRVPAPRTVQVKRNQTTRVDVKLELAS